MGTHRMTIEGADVAVVGGSIAGCATALAAHRAGAGRITLHERTAGLLADRGVGLAVHNARYAELAAAGYLDTAMPWAQLTTRRWYVRDGAAPLGRQIGVQPFPFRSYCWGPLWRELRQRLPQDTVFRTGTPVTAVDGDAEGAVLHFGGGNGAGEGGGAAGGPQDRARTGGRTERFDLVIGADGYRSAAPPWGHLPLRACRRAPFPTRCTPISATSRASCCRRTGADWSS